MIKSNPKQPATATNLHVCSFHTRLICEQVSLQRIIRVYYNMYIQYIL